MQQLPISVLAKRDISQVQDSLNLKYEGKELGKSPKYERGKKAVEMFIWWDRRYLVVMSLIQDQEIGVCGEAVKYGPRHRRKQDQEMCHLHMAASGQDPK
ncbi:Uncharacterized protein HZ326_21705 [Fusarium oxysporum f. sp. albedinis]|nr:Uncharacterized protein HZ326_21705 [Fusarium oxysporum f. sp. albedinis]